MNEILLLCIMVFPDMNLTFTTNGINCLTNDSFALEEGVKIRPTVKDNTRLKIYYLEHSQFEKYSPFKRYNMDFHVPYTFDKLRTWKE